MNQELGYALVGPNLMTETKSQPTLPTYLQRLICSTNVVVGSSHGLWGWLMLNCQVQCLLQVVETFVSLVARLLQSAIQTKP